MDFKEVIDKRRTHRDYTDQPVDRRVLEKLVDAANKAPVSCNLQLTKYILVDDKKLLEKLSKQVSYKFNYSPCTIVVLYDSRFTIKRHSAVMTVGMAVENMILEATNLGLGTCPMAGFGKDKKIKNILNIPDHFNIALLLSVGYPNSEVKLREMPKIDKGHTFAFNNFDNLRTISESDNLDDHSIDSIIDYRSRIAPVYLDRFRLNTWKNKYYKEVVAFFKKNILSEYNLLLDVMSYDGEFLKDLKEESDITVIASDYIEDNLNYFKEYFNCQVNKIDSNNNIVGIEDGSVDLMTFIFQLKFTPHVDSLIKSMNSKLKSGGKIFVASVTESFVKRSVKKFIKFYKKTFKGEVYNIYENNPYYRVGPIKHLSDSEIVSLFENNKLNLIKKGLISQYRSLGVKINFYLFEK